MAAVGVPVPADADPHPGAVTQPTAAGGHVRARVRALPGVRLLESCAITGLTAVGDQSPAGRVAGSTVTGVRIRPDRGDERTVAADLVVDATGRGSRTPVWLAELGYRRPAEDRVEIGLGYATRTFRLRPDPLDGDVLVLQGGTPGNPRMAALAPVEGRRHIVTLGGILGDEPPLEAADFTAFAESLAFPDVAAALVGAEPLDEGTAFAFPANTRRRYEQLPDFPARFLVIGDAVCSFNPIYGQGMTVAAMQAQVLRRLLAASPVPDPQPYFTAIGKVVDGQWQVAVGANLAYPGGTGPPYRAGPAGQRLPAPPAHRGGVGPRARCGLPPGARAAGSAGGPAASRPGGAGRRRAPAPHHRHRTGATAAFARGRSHRPVGTGAAVSTRMVRARCATSRPPGPAGQARKRAR